MASTAGKEEAKARPSADLILLAEAVRSTLSAVVWGLEGTGKSLFVLREFPLPIMVLNLDRDLTPSHLEALPKERQGQIFVKNLREDLMSLDHMTGLQVKASIEDTITRNLDYFKGGTIFLDGGSLWRDILKFADSKIGKMIEEGKRWNPKEKAAINAYLGTFIHHIVSQGINFAISAHGAWSWEMTSNPETGKQSLMKTNKVYPKLDDVAFEQTSLSLLMVKKCECGRNIVNQDGTCTGVGGQKHEGRQHVTRIVTNKHFTRSEGSEWPNMTFRTLQTLCFQPAKAEVLLGTA